MGVLETASVLLKFRSGVLLNMDMGRSSPSGYIDQCTAVGTQGHLQVRMLLQLTHAVTPEQMCHAMLLARWITASCT